MTLDPVQERLWRFLRGDEPLWDFQAWVYAEPSLEERLGAELYLLAISTNYSSAEAVDRLRDELRAFSRASTPLACGCIELADEGIVDMDMEGCTQMAALREVKKRGMPQWWLSIRQCPACAQWWLVAQEERHNDIFCLRRVAPEEAAAVVDHDRWPPQFDTFEALLRFGARAGRSVRFAEPLTCNALPYTIEDLARARPGIRVTELAELLALELDLARLLAERVVREKGVRIDFDAPSSKELS